MKTNLAFTAVTILFTTVASHCIAQPEPPRPGGRGPAGPPEMRSQPLQTVTAYTGKAGDWVSNDDYVYDGFYLQAASGKLLVKFPRHLGSQLTKAIKSGSDITVNGAENTNAEGVREIRMVSIVANGQTFTDTPSAVPATPMAEAAASGTGKITALQKDREGRVNGYIIDDKTILRMPPHVVEQLGSLATTGANISFTGMKKTANEGEASSKNYTVVHCQTFTVNGTQYLTR